MTIQTKFRYSVVVTFKDDGDVEDMMFGDQETLEVLSLDISKCPEFMVERVAWLKLVPTGHSIREGGKLLGLKFDATRGHIYLDHKEKTNLFTLIKEKDRVTNI